MAHSSLGHNQQWNGRYKSRALHVAKAGFISGFGLDVGEEGGGIKKVP